MTHSFYAGALLTAATLTTSVAQAQTDAVPQGDTIVIDNQGYRIKVDASLRPQAGGLKIVGAGHRDHNGIATI